MQPLIRWGTATLRTDSFVNEELFVSLCLLFFDNLTAILTEKNTAVECAVEAAPILQLGIGVLRVRARLSRYKSRYSRFNVCLVRISKLEPELDKSRLYRQLSGISRGVHIRCKNTCVCVRARACMHVCMYARTHACMYIHLHRAPWPAYSAKRRCCTWKPPPTSRPRAHWHIPPAGGLGTGVRTPPDLNTLETPGMEHV